MTEDKDITFELERPDIKNAEERIDYIAHLYEEIQEAKQLLEDAKKEYGKVTSFLKDIQLIDNAPEESEKVIKDVAAGIFELEKERETIQKHRYQFSGEQRLAQELNEGQVYEDINSLREYEQFMMNVKDDIRHLKEEKQNLRKEKKNIIEKQSMLRVLTKSLTIISISMVFLMIAVFLCFEVDVTFAFIGLVAFLLIVLAIILYESRKNHTEMALNEKKINKAIRLLNKIKIKYVNTHNVINAITGRYYVKDSTELEYVANQYAKAKREWLQQNENTKTLANYNNVLVSELKKLGVKDYELWYYQAEALINPKEMVEIRHRLNTERQAIRERIDGIAEVNQKCLREMEEIRNMNAEYKQDVEDVLREYVMR